VVADQLVDYLDYPERLAAMAKDLRSLRGPSGAAAKLATMVVAELRMDHFGGRVFPAVKGDGLG
jgi:hypothetical protein